MLLQSSRKLLSLMLFALLAGLLTACGASDSGTSGSTAAIQLPSYMRQGYETYHENGGVNRPNNAIDVFILYSPESQQYMPRIIQQFNQLSTSGKNPVTGQDWASGESPIYVHGQQPTTGSSGTAAQGVVNAIIAPSNANVYHPTIFQPSVSHWLALVNQQSGRDVFNLADARATALSPVVIAMWESRVRAIQQQIGSEDIGWEDLLAVLNSPNGWEDYGVLAGRRAIYYGHTDPNVSSTGLSTTIAEYYTCAQQNGFDEPRLSLAAVNDAAVQSCVQGIEQLVRHYSSRTEDFLQYIAQGPDYLDMLALEETDLICLNTGGQQGDQTCNKPQERLIAIYPEEGTFVHEHPFGIVAADWVTAEQQQAARVFTDFVLTPDMQRLIMAEGFRPANPSVNLEYPFTEENGVDVNRPSALLNVPSAETIIAIQQSWNVVKKQADILLVVDVSGSMETEGRLNQARESISVFLNELESTTRIGLISFSDTVTIWDPIDLLERNRSSILLHVTCTSQQGFQPPNNALSGKCLQPNGSTSLFTAIRTGIDILDANSTPDRIRAVIVLSDGQDTCEGDGCSSVQDVINKIERTRSTLNPVIVIPIAYGSDADVSVLQPIARSSATQVQSSDPNNIARLLQLLSSFF